MGFAHARLTMLGIPLVIVLVHVSHTYVLSVPRRPNNTDTLSSIYIHTRTIHGQKHVRNGKRMRRQCIKMASFLQHPVSVSPILPLFIFTYGH